MTREQDEQEEEEIPWTDDAIRWSKEELQHTAVDKHEDDDSDGEFEVMDPFRDHNPTEIVTYQFPTRQRSDAAATITVDLEGHKEGSDAVWTSTGLCLWKAAQHLCKYIVENAEDFEGKRILEVRGSFVLFGLVSVSAAMKAQNFVDMRFL